MTGDARRDDRDWTLQPLAEKEPVRPLTAPANPFALVPGGQRPAAPLPERKDLVARLGRVFAAAREHGSLGPPLRTVTAGFLDAGGWRVGIGLLRSEDGTLSASALAVFDRDSAVHWRTAVSETESGDLERLGDSRATYRAETLPLRIATQAGAQGLDTADVYPIDGGGRNAGVLVLLRASSTGMPPEVRQGLEVAVDILTELAGRMRARAAVRRAARHVREVGTELASARDAAREAAARMAALCRGAEPGLWVWDLDPDRLHLSPRWKSVLGYGARDLGDQPSEWFDRIHANDSDRVELELLEHLEGHSPRFESEHRLLHVDGTYRWVRIRGVADRDDAGKAIRIAGSMTDITETRAQDRRTTRDLLYHRLTGFPTSPLLIDRIDQAMRRRARRPDRSFAVLGVALDGLRETADRVGVEATEELVLTAARRISTAVRPGDTVAHRGELDFGVVLDDVKSLDDAVRISERIATVLRQEIPLGEESVKLPPAIGLALSRTGYETADEMVRDSDIALRKARREGATLQVFDAATKAFAQSLTELEGDLRRAFDQRQLFLEYQPVVSLADGRILGVEAFVRWTHPGRGPISPAEFLPVAEEAGLLQELGGWVIERACRQMSEWIEGLTLSFSPSIAINVTASQLFDEAFVGRTLATIEGSGLDPSLVRIDVSESTFMKDGPTAGRILRSLAQRGVQIAVDDFGTGYSSLSYLHRYPIGALKIDRSFVSGAAGARNEWDVARTIIELAKILDLEVIAEGIETREQFQQLRALGCRQAQGYFFSGPVSASRAAKLLQSGYPVDVAPTVG